MNKDLYICTVRDTCLAGVPNTIIKQARIIVYGKSSLKQFREMLSWNKCFSLDVKHVPCYEQLEFNFIENDLQSPEFSVL